MADIKQAETSPLRKQKVVIIGAGPTGLGAAWRMNELQFAGMSNIDYVVIDAQEDAGGLAHSWVDENGFVWDLGAHVMFSHYSYFTTLLDHLIDDYQIRQREAWARMRGVWIPYPVQNNIHRLPNEELIKCLTGLVEVEKKRASFTKPKDFSEWLLQAFGQGLCDVFMFPYNYKVWAHHPHQMNVEWMGERVATVDINKIISNAITKEDELGWGPNATFRFPTYGGTGSIWRALANEIPAEKKMFNKRVVSIDAKSNIVKLNDGQEIAYDAIVSTMPLDRLISLTKNWSQMKQEEIEEKAKQFKWSTTHVVCFGMDGKLPEDLEGKSWIYFPDMNCPFYRASIFSNFSPYVVPKPGQQWSIMLEISDSQHKPVPQDQKELIELARQGLINVGILKESDKIVTTFYKREPYGYPTPFVGRDQLTGPLFSELEKSRIYSRGRFGAWKYEVANQDHSMMQGVECVDHILFGTEETTVKFPNVVNAFKDGGARKPIIAALSKNRK